MDVLTPLPPQEIIHDLIAPQGNFPNNTKYPLVLYKQVFSFTSKNPQQVQQLLKQNHWINSWVDSIYDYHHYHSNTHETLVIIEGSCHVQIGGERGKIYSITQGDAIIFPAGVAHKNAGASSDFKCIGAYPTETDYDMNYGQAEEHPLVDENIKKVQLPEQDPIFGMNGPLFNFWK